MKKIQKYILGLLTPLSLGCVPEPKRCDYMSEKNNPVCRAYFDVAQDVQVDSMRGRNHDDLEQVVQDTYLAEEEVFVAGNDTIENVIAEVKDKGDSSSVCYNNNFTTESDFAKIISENDAWIWNKKGYVQQKESGSGNKVSIVNNVDYTNFEASVKFRMIDSGIGVNQYTAFPFRYDFMADKGYALVIGHADGNTFSFSLYDWPKGPIKGVTMNCSPNISTTDCGVMYNNWYTLKVKAIGDNITAYFEGEEVFTTQKALYSSGKIGLATISVRADFDDVDICPNDTAP